MVGRVTPCAPWSQKNWIKESCLVRRARSDAPYPPSDAHYPTLTHRDEGNSFSFLIAGNSLCPWIKNRFAIDQKPIMVMPMMQWHLEKPCPIRLPFHRVRRRVPTIEVPQQMHFFGFRRDTDEIHRFGHFFGGITI